MDDWSACMIDTRIVYGFKGAGKTHYIRDCIINDYFYKYGTTLILCFEQGKEEYDSKMLESRNAFAAYYDGQSDIGEFCMDPVRKYNPGRIYVEMNTRFQDLRSDLPEMLNITAVVTIMNWQTLSVDIMHFKKKLYQMVSESRQITFRSCPSKEVLAPYSQEFKLMNPQASYLRQDPMGYHEKAFDIFVPYSLEEDNITIDDGNYLPLWLDAAEHPEHYDGKMLCFTDPLELRHVADDSIWSAGRVVMTCCMADLQFMAFELLDTGSVDVQGGWIIMEAQGCIVKDEYGRKALKLKPQVINPAAAPKSGLILQSSLRPARPDPSLASTMFEHLSSRHQV